MKSYSRSTERMTRFEPQLDGPIQWLTQRVRADFSMEYTDSLAPLPASSFMKRLGSFIDLRYTAVFLAIAAVVSFFLSKWSGLRFWITFLIVAAAILINGWIAAREDERSGGFHNPKNDKNEE